MRLICPACGATSSAEAMGNDALARETMAIVVKLPPPVPAAVLGYLSLFRPGTERALSWKKAKRLAREIEDLTAQGYVSRPGAIDRDCPPRIWAAAMEAMAVNPTLRRPMNGHNYLKKVAYDLAEASAAAHEAGIRTAEQSHRRPLRSLSGVEGSGVEGRPAVKSKLQQYIDGEIDEQP